MKRAMFPVLVAVATAAAFGAHADEAQVLSYGVVEAVRPAAVSGGFLGMGKEPGRAYTIRRVGEAESIEVTSKNVSFLVGDCVAIAGAGKDTTLSRAQAPMCSEAGAKVPGREVGAAEGPWNSQGSESPACQHAREEANALPMGLARRRALFRELVVCEPAPSADCRKAWDAVYALPFGPDRAAARERARRACDSKP